MSHYSRRSVGYPLLVVLLLLPLLASTMPAPARAAPAPAIRVAPLQQASCPPKSPDLPAPPIPGTNFCVYYNDNPMIANSITKMQATTAANQVQRYWDRYTNDFGFLDPARTGLLEVHLRPNAGCDGGTDSRFNYIRVYTGCFKYSELIQLALGHELFHRVQYSYDPNEAEWFSEGTARAMQDLAFANIDNWAPLPLEDYLFNKAVNDYLRLTNKDITSYDMRYNSALWWKYFTEQYGTIMTEPERGVDALLRLWDAARTANDIAAVNQALAALGARTNFDTAFRRFTVANYTKDLTGVPDKSYNYIDEDLGGPAYGPLVPINIGTIKVGPEVPFPKEKIERYGVRYYEATPDSAKCPVISAKFLNPKNGPAFYHVVTEKLKGTDEHVFASHGEGSGASWTYSYLNDGIAKVVAILGSLGNASEDVEVTLSCAQPVVDIKLPNSGAVAYAGASGKPGKILAQVLVTNGSPTAPIAGLTSANFTARVNGQTAKVTGGGFVQEQYWLVIEPPNLLTSGTFDLEIGLQAPGSSTPIAPKINRASVVFGADNLDHALVIDRSGSMSQDNKMTAAQAAAKFYVDITSDRDGLAIVPYNQDVSPAPFAMQLVDQALRDKAKRYINDLSALGSTSIGDGLREAVNQRSNSRTGNMRCSFVLLSDGMQNTAAFWNEVKDAVKATKCPVTSIAFGKATDETLMQEIAATTGGPFFYNDVFVSGLAQAATPDDTALDLVDTYEYAQARDEGRQRLMAERGSAPPNVGQTHSVMIDDTVSEALFALDWNTSRADMSLRLRQPDGTIIDTKTISYTFSDFDSGHLGWRIQNPQPGEWQMLVVQHLIEGHQEVPYQVLVSGLSNLTVELLLPDRLGQQFYTGNRVPIYAFVSADGPIAGLPVEATVTAPDGTKTTVPLLDDGQHSDGGAGDGFYAGVYTRVNQAEEIQPSGEDVASPPAQDQAAYQVRVRAGDASFQREALGSFAVLEGPDANGNGLPDPFEAETGIGDPGSDPDLDALDTLHEYLNGTDPNNSDSDDGGENDGSEVLHGQNPLDPSDDQIAKPDFFHTAPDNGAARLGYDVKGEYTRLLLYRSASPDGPWTVGTDLPLSGSYNDPAANDTAVYYRLLAIDADDHRSAVLKGEAVTPRADPIPPAARILIDRGAPSTPDLNVRLSFAPYEGGDEAFADITEVLLSNDPSFAGAQWRPFAQNIRWRLAPTPPGSLAQVYARFRDDAGNESVGTEVASIIFAGRNRAPVARGDSYSTPNDTPLVIAAPGVLGNDSDADGDSLNAVLVSRPGHGGLTLNADGSFTYTPNRNFSGSDSFTYKASDGRADSNMAVVSLIVRARSTSFPSTGIRDNFNRQNSPLVNNWYGEARLTGYQVVDKELDIGSGGPISWKAGAFGPMIETYATFVRVDPGGEQALLLKVQGDIPDYRQGAIKVVYDAGARLVRVETIAPGQSAWTVRGSFAATLHDGDQLGARALADGRVEVFLNGRQIGAADAGSFFVNKRGRIGLWFHDASDAVLDDFGGGTPSR